EAACSGNPKAFLIPATLHWIPPVSMRLDFHVAFGRDDRAIAIGPQGPGGVASSGPAPANTGRSLGHVFLKALSDSMKNAAAAEKQRQAKESERSSSTPPPDTIPTPSDDPIGPGGFIVPPPR